MQSYVEALNGLYKRLSEDDKVKVVAHIVEESKRHDKTARSPDLDQAIDDVIIALAGPEKRLREARKRLEGVSGDSSGIVRVATSAG
jgi:hypothetical protein